MTIINNNEPPKPMSGGGEPRSKLSIAVANALLKNMKLSLSGTKYEKHVL